MKKLVLIISILLLFTLSTLANVNKEDKKLCSGFGKWTEEGEFKIIRKKCITEKEYEVEYWILTRDGYDNEYITVKAGSEKEALEKAEEETRRGKNFKIYKR